MNGVEYSATRATSQAQTSLVALVPVHDDVDFVELNGALDEVVDRTSQLGDCFVARLAEDRRLSISNTHVARW